jgi:ABC-type sulfate/molybdate transport systems ATPase subunit
MSKRYSLLSVRDLRVRAANTILLEAISFDCAGGELKGVFGASGAGKSTLLHALAGISDPAFRISGSILLNGVEIANASAESRSHMGVAIVLQGLHLFPDLDVVENVAYALRRRGVDQTNAHCRAMETLQTFHIERLAKRRINELSGGQQQRVALARAVIYKPSLLLLDEPFKGLEQALRDQLLADICMQVRDGIAVLLVTHEKRELRVAADSLIELRNGQLLGAEDHRSDELHGGFKTTMDTVLVPSANGQSGFIQVHLISISPHGTPKSSNGSSKIKAQLLERRRSDRFRAALLVRYESGQACWIEVPFSDSVGFQAGQWMDIEYESTSVQEKTNVC